MTEVEKIEVSVRTQMACISTEESGAFWFSDSKLFTNGKIHTDVYGMRTAVGLGVSFWSASACGIRQG